jgi:ABC transporter substrate binding protein
MTPAFRAGAIKGLADSQFPLPDGSLSDTLRLSRKVSFERRQTCGGATLSSCFWAERRLRRRDWRAQQLERVIADPFTAEHRIRIIELAAHHRVPAIYPRRIFVVDGGLIAYGTDVLDLFKSAAGYVDRILRGERPGDLPAQTPPKYELTINLKTARALGLIVPPSLLARADEVIE